MIADRDLNELQSAGLIEIVAMNMDGTQQFDVTCLGQQYVQFFVRERGEPLERVHLRPELIPGNLAPTIGEAGPGPPPRPRLRRSERIPEPGPLDDRHPAGPSRAPRSAICPGQNEHMLILSAPNEGVQSFLYVPPNEDPPGISYGPVFVCGS